jgi:Uncharacterised nucleotidyltransferase
MRLLIECARASIGPERAGRIRELSAGGLDWTRLLTLAERNGLRPLLYSHLSSICPERVPPETFAFLRDYFQKNAAFNLLLTGELLRLVALLNDHGIEAMPLKGPAIAVMLYGHVRLRQFGDLDILVRTPDIWRASEIFEAQGFEPQYPIPAEWRDAYVRQDYARLFHRDGGRTIVELHWGIAERSFGVRFDADAMWSRRQSMTLQGHTVPSPSAEDLMLMLCVHGARHAWDKLEALCSLAELARREDLDWTYIWRTARDMRCERMLAFPLWLAYGLLDVSLPREAAALADSRAFHAMANRVVRDFYADVVQSQTPTRQLALKMRLKDSYADCARYGVGLAFTAKPDDWAAVRLRGPLSFGYPLVRAFRRARKHATHQHHAAGGRP